MKKAQTQAKKEERKYKYLLVSGVVILSFLVALAVFGKKGVIQLKDIQQKKAVLQAKVAKLEKENSELKENIGALRSDKREIEKIAREELDLVKPGEVVYQFIQEKD